MDLVISIRINLYNILLPSVIRDDETVVLVSGQHQFKFAIIVEFLTVTTTGGITTTPKCVESHASREQYAQAKSIIIAILL